MSVNICIATKDDYRFIYCYRNKLYEYIIPPLLQSVNEAFADCERSLVLKALNDNIIVGSIRGYKINNICYINKLMVSPGFRCNGIGTALLLKIEKQFPNCNYELFTGIKSLKNIALYERNGYKIFHIDMDKELVFMKKPFSATV